MLIQNSQKSFEGYFWALRLELAVIISLFPTREEAAEKRMVYLIGWRVFVTVGRHDVVRGLQ